jgi:hypothetical protein
MNNDEPGMDHIDAVLKSDSDNFVLSEVRCDGSEAFANLIGFIGLVGQNVKYCQKMNGKRELLFDDERRADLHRSR